LTHRAELFLEILKEQHAATSAQEQEIAAPARKTHHSRATSRKTAPF